MFCCEHSSEKMIELSQDSLVPRRTQGTFHNSVSLDGDYIVGETFMRSLLKIHTESQILEEENISK